ncbi:HDOD domain-containing protein [Pseudomarimonas salicorniae]|uniref:HDOD domain-containing protein n=1 Tax=Pseudomarimonas salicorniae TaxID=2933270 RepID=A0ABT0GGM3_9GAMM|nr:HDOD domain-containing protein [Lysobacter sp. CAU 1642]MCK7593354.1 HDOD domain-containing protein [Lysobacter sp. CAU 1642]
MDRMARATTSLDEWVHQLTSRQLPAFARTAQRIAGKAQDADSSAGELAALILQDVSMTTRLLRMANSILFNPSGGRISTISRAIIVLGFDAVRDLCLSIAIIDGLLKGPNRELVARGMGTALHAALQARNLARIARLPEAEEVFVATLLSHLGELALMCFAGEAQPDLPARLAAIRRLPAAKREAAETELLGFQLRELTASLNREWRLSGLLSRTLDRRSPPDARVRAVQYGDALAECLARGDQGAALDALIVEACDTLRLAAEPLRESVLSTWRDASEAGHALGADLAREQRPAPVSEPPRWNTGDAGLQMAVLREISQLLIEQQPSVGALMELVLEGLFRGVGLDRVVFALLSPDRRLLRQKTALSIDPVGLETGFEFAARPAEANPLAWCLGHDQPLWLGGPGAGQVPGDRKLEALCGGQCLILPLAVGATPIGCLYADRAASGRELSDELYTQFRLFGHQARLGLAFIKSR